MNQHEMFDTGVHQSLRERKDGPYIILTYGVESYDLAADLVLRISASGRVEFYGPNSKDHGWMGTL